MRLLLQALGATRGTSERRAFASNIRRPADEERTLTMPKPENSTGEFIDRWISIVWDIWADGYKYSCANAIGIAGPGSSPLRAMQVLQSDPDSIFPFTVKSLDGDRSIRENAVYDLRHVRDPLNKFDTKNYVRVTEVTDRSFTFTTLEGHFDGPDGTIKFTTYESGGWVYLRQDAYAPNAPWWNGLIAPLGAKYLTWPQQAWNLAQALREHPIFNPESSRYGGAPDRPEILNQPLVTRDRPPSAIPEYDPESPQHGGDPGPAEQSYNRRSHDGNRGWDPSHPDYWDPQRIHQAPERSRPGTAPQPEFVEEEMGFWEAFITQGGIGGELPRDHPGHLCNNPLFADDMRCLSWVEWMDVQSRKMEAHRKKWTAEAHAKFEEIEREHDRFIAEMDAHAEEMGIRISEGLRQANIEFKKEIRRLRDFGDSAGKDRQAFLDKGSARAAKAAAKRKAEFKKWVANIGNQKPTRTPTFDNRGSKRNPDPIGGFGGGGMPPNHGSTHGNAPRHGHRPRTGIQYQPTGRSTSPPDDDSDERSSSSGSGGRSEPVRRSKTTTTSRGTGSGSSGGGRSGSRSPGKTSPMRKPSSSPKTPKKHDSYGDFVQGPDGRWRKKRR